MRYAIVIERADGNFSAFAPDLPGCAAVGDTRDEVLESMREAIEFHLEGLRQADLPIPPPTTEVAVIEVAPAA